MAFLPRRECLFLPSPMLVSSLSNARGICVTSYLNFAVSTPSQGGFPQSLTLSLPSRCHVETLDILSNQAKIAESVEIYLGDRSSETIGEDDDVFNLGYITFDRNDQSDYQASAHAAILYFV